MRDPDENGWESSSSAWIERMSLNGDFAREFILDKPMLQRVSQANAKTMLDIGCGEGRFCRMAAHQGIQTTGLDPVESFIASAQAQHAAGEYVTGFAEDLPFPDASFDLVVFYLTLIDIDDMPAAINEAVRVTKSGGVILIANLTSFFTANGTLGWVTGQDGRVYHPLGNYMETRADWFEWGGLRIRNWHRPFGDYMNACLDAGLTLTFFDEPKPSGGPKERVERYLRTPFTMIMEWRCS